MAIRSSDDGYGESARGHTAYNPHTAQAWCDNEVVLDFLREADIPDEEMAPLLEECLGQTWEGWSAAANRWLEAHNRPIIWPDTREPDPPGPPRWATPQQLREHCQKLREDWSILDSDATIDTLFLSVPASSEAATSFFRGSLNEVWRAMRLMDEVSSPPSYHPRNVADLHDALNKLGEAIAWCNSNNSLTGSAECFVTLQQAAAMVSRSKKTLERRKKEMPAPKVSGGGGKPDEWAWSELRPWLEKEFERSLPERFPADQFHTS